MKKAFEKILERLEELQNNLLSQTEDDISVQVGIINGVMYSKKIVQEIAEEYNGGWIPCSERLPEENGDYLTTSKIYFVPDHVDEIDNYVGVKISHYSTEFGWIDEEVIAWQPLPESYKSKGENKR